MRLIHRSSLALSIFLGLMISPSAFATSYGDFRAPSGTVSYVNVHDEAGLIGSATVSVNSLDFSPGAFEAQCSRCPQGVTSREVLTLEVESLGDQSIDFVQLSEGLHSSLQSFDPTGFAAVSISAYAVVDILELDGRSNPGPSFATSIAFAPTSVAAVFGSDAASEVMLGTTGWIDLREIIALTGENGRATRVRLTVENVLQAFAEGDGGSAGIRLGDLDLVTYTSGPLRPVPEPSTAVLALGGLALLASRRPRDAIAVVADDG